MKIRTYNLIVLALVLFMAAIMPKTCAASTTSSEYQIKAAFLYNFIKFVDWPEEKLPDSNEPIIIGIIGKNLFGNAFEPLKNKSAKGETVIIKHFKGLEELEKSKEKTEQHEQLDAIRESHLLFICRSEKKKFTEIINMVDGHSVLTIADDEGFLESGGIINFVMEENKVRFEVSVAAAKRAKIKIRSQLLRLAKRIVKE